MTPRKRRYLSRGLMLMKLKQRFDRLNPNEEWDDVDRDNLDYPCEYGEALHDFANANPRFRWFFDNDPYKVELFEEDMERALQKEIEEENKKSIKVHLKVYFQKSKKGKRYAYVKGTISMKEPALIRYGRRPVKECTIDYPLEEQNQ